MNETDLTNGVPLTPLEEEILRTALDAGYFEVPRHISTVALAEETGMGDRELSERLRRAMAKAARYRLGTMAPPDGD